MRNLSPSRRRRRGSALIAVLVCLLVVGLLVAGLVRTMVLQQRQLRRQSWRAQATWLAESGVARARQSLQVDDEYKGETWQLSSEEMSGDESGRVTIRLAPIDDGSEKVELFVEAIYPDDPIDRAQHYIRLLLNVKSQGDSS